ncbi:HTH_Tnp_Tc3_2 domain-containing protein [Trichonephila clavipes]|nr:HTH_Tnp_Tc3_2 domain-containing protein [Trichonephila clavipes]
MPRLRSRNTCRHVSDFDRGQIVAYHKCGLSYRSITSRVGRNPVTVSRIRNRGFKDGNMERCARSQRPPMTNSREDMHVTRMTLMDCLTTSRDLSQEMESFAREVSARTV